jgi:RNA polymerase sigma-70 factor (ECF subfamily)
VILMLAFQAGDDSAFERLVEEYQGAAFAMLRRLLGPGAALEDLAQEAFIRIWRSRERYRPEGKFSTLLYRVTYNLALNRIRDERRKPALSLPTDPQGATVEPADLREQALDAPLDQGVWAERIGLALQALPENQRAALVFQHYQGLDLAEIASILELSPQAVKSLLHRAREGMRELLEAHWNSEK